jgi:hypothetical protein
LFGEPFNDQLAPGCQKASLSFIQNPLFFGISLNPGSVELFHIFAPMERETILVAAVQYEGMAFISL